jgi:hypothetical protein
MPYYVKENFYNHKNDDEYYNQVVPKKKEKTTMFKNRARMLIAFIASILVLLIKVFIPDLPFTDEQFTGFLVLVGAYILGEGLEGDRIKDNFKLLFKSNKFHALIAGLILWIVNGLFPEFPITEDQVFSIISILATLIVGAGVQGAVTKTRFVG